MLHDLAQHERRLLASTLCLLVAVGAFLVAVVAIVSGHDGGAWALPLAPTALIASLILLPGF